MSQSIHGAIHDNDPRLAPSPWRRTSATLLHLGLVAMAAVAAGIFVFPIR